MPVHNGEDTLHIAVSSLINQTYTNWKCIIVNDGSTDGTMGILDCLDDERFVVIHFEQNKGRPYARQAALELADGEYLSFLDADDFYHPDKIDSQVKIFESNSKISLVSCGNASFDSNMKLVSVRGTSQKDGALKKFRYGPVLNVAMRTSMVKLGMAKKVNFDVKLLYSQDVDFLTRYLHDKYYYVQDKVYYYYSELVSVNKSKILNTYHYGIKRNLGYINRFNKIKVLKSITIIALKYSFFTLRLMLQNDKNIIAKRGRKPLPDEVATFKDTILKLDE